MAVGDIDTIRFGTAVDDADGADDAIAEADTGDDDALSDGADDTGAVVDPAVVDAIGAAVDTAADGVVGDGVAPAGDEAVPPLPVPQPARSAQQVRVAARTDRIRIDVLTVVEERATLDGHQRCRQPAPIPRGGLITPIRQATWLASGRGPQLRDSAGFSPDFADGEQT